MKVFARVLTVLMLAVMVFSLLPNMEAPAQAAGNPILVINPTTAVNPILDHVLDFNTYSSGGPFTVSFDWKCDLKLNDATKSEYFASVIVEGTVYGSTTQTQAYPGYRISGNTGWQTKTFQFQNVGVYNVSGSNQPGGILRFYVLYAKGEFQIRNITIKNAAGTVLYNLNTDPVVAQAMTDMRNAGMTEWDMGELAAIDYENCPWVAGQFATGAYSCFLREDSTATQTTTTTATRPTRSSTTTKATTKATTTKATTTKATTTKATTTKATTTKATTTKATTTKATTTKATTTKATTTKLTTTKATTTVHNCNVQGHKYVGGQCRYCGLSDPNYNYCLDKGHNYQNGYCIVCDAHDPNWNPPTVPPTTPPTVPPTAPPTVSTTTQLTTGAPIMGGTTGNPGGESIINPTDDRINDYDDDDRDTDDKDDGYGMILIILLSILCGGVATVIILLMVKMLKEKK